MKIKEDSILISDNNEVFWKDVKRIRLINNKLALILHDETEVELPNLRPDLIDQTFLTYERYLKNKTQKR